MPFVIGDYLVVTSWSKWQRQDLNLRSSGYEPDEMIGLLYSAMDANSA